MIIRTYEELITLPTFEMRFKYLSLKAPIGYTTFGFDRYINQAFYHSNEWISFKNKLIIRDNGCDLCFPGRDIYGFIHVHHLNPLTVEDFKSGSKKLFDPNNLVCVSLATHNAIHYGSIDSLPTQLIDRQPNDTCPWKH